MKIKTNNNIRIVNNGDLLFYDKNISFDANGLYKYLLAINTDFYLTKETLCKVIDISKNRIKTALDELIAKNYIFRYAKNENNQYYFQYTIYHKQYDEPF